LWKASTQAGRQDGRTKQRDGQKEG
jgi:hypothetical protein